MLSSNLIYGSHEQISALVQNSSEVSTSLQARSAQLGVIETKLDGIGIHLTNEELRQGQQWSAIQATLDQTKASYDTTQANRSNQLQAIVTTINESYAKGEDQLNAINAKLNESQSKLSGEFQSLDSKCSLILEVVQSLNSLALLDKQGDISSVLQKIQEQTNQAREQATAHADRAQTPRVDSPPVAGGCGEFLSNIDFLNSIDRLCNLVDYNEITCITEDVEEIIDDLQTVLRAAQHQSDELADVRRLRRVSGLLDSAHMLSINGGGEYKHKIFHRRN